MIQLADASAEASKVEHCSTFAASNASLPQCSSAKRDVTPFKVNGQKRWSFNARRRVDGPSDSSFLPSVVLNPDNIYSPNAWAQYIVTGCNPINIISPKFFKTSYWHIRVTLPQHLMRPLSLSGQPPVCFGMLHMLTSQRKPREKNTILASPVMFVVFFSNPVRSWWKW